MANISIPLLFDREVVRQLLENNKELLELFPSEEKPIDREDLQAVDELFEREAPAAGIATNTPQETSPNSSENHSQGGRLQSEIEQEQGQDTFLDEIESFARDFETVPNTFNVSNQRLLDTSSIFAPLAKVNQVAGENKSDRDTGDGGDEGGQFVPVIVGESVLLDRYAAKMQVLDKQSFDFNSAELGIIAYGTAYGDVRVYGINLDTNVQGLAVADSNDNDISVTLRAPWNGGNIENEDTGYIGLIPKQINDPDNYETANPSGYAYLLFADPIAKFGMDVFSLQSSVSDSMALTFYDASNNTVTIHFDDFTDSHSNYYDSTVSYGNNSANRISPIDVTQLGLGDIKLVAITVASEVGFDHFVYGEYVEQKINTTHHGNLLTNDILESEDHITTIMLTASSAADAAIYVGNNLSINPVQNDSQIEISISAQTTIPTILGGIFTVSPNGEYSYTTAASGTELIEYKVTTLAGNKSGDLDITVNGHQSYAVDDTFFINSSGILSYNVLFNDFISDTSTVTGIDNNSVASNGIYNYMVSDNGGEIWIKNTGDFVYRAPNSVAGYSDVFSVDINDNGTALSSELTITVGQTGEGFTTLTAPTTLTTTGQTDWVQLKSSLSATEFTIDMGNTDVNKIFINDLISYDNNQLSFINNTDFNTDSVININDVISTISQTDPNGLMTIDLTNSSTLYLQNAGTVAGLTPEDFLQHLTDLSIQVDIL